MPIIKCLVILAYQVISNLSATTAPLFTMESWGRFPKERDRLFKLIADSKVKTFFVELFWFLLFSVLGLLFFANKLFFCAFLVKEHIRTKIFSVSIYFTILFIPSSCVRGMEYSL